MNCPMSVVCFRTSMCIILFCIVLLGCSPDETVETRLQFDITEMRQKYKFEYGNQYYVMDSFYDLFPDTHLGVGRRKLFEHYLENSDEGKKRVEALGSASTEAVWTCMTIEEKTTFLAITAAMSRLKTDAGDNLLDWICSLKEIHGERSFVKRTKRYANKEAFRLYVSLTSAAVDHLNSKRGGVTSSVNESKREYCRNNYFGTTHIDFCRIGKIYDIPAYKLYFDTERKLGEAPGLHFSYSIDSNCADIDIDYRKLINGHMRRLNSNILAAKHLQNYESVYGDPGFRKRY